MVLADASTRPTVATAADQRSFFDRRRQCGHHCAKKLLGSDWPDRLRPAQGAAPAVTDLVGIPTRLQSAVASNEPQRFSSQLFNTQPKERVADAVASDPRFVAVKCRKLPGESASICKHKRRRKHVQGVQRGGFPANRRHQRLKELIRTRHQGRSRHNLATAKSRQGTNIHFCCSCSQEKLPHDKRRVCCKAFTPCDKLETRQHSPGNSRIFALDRRHESNLCCAECPMEDANAFELI